MRKGNFLLITVGVLAAAYGAVSLCSNSNGTEDSTTTGRNQDISKNVCERPYDLGRKKYEGLGRLTEVNTLKGFDRTLRPEPYDFLIGEIEGKSVVIGRDLRVQSNLASDIYRRNGTICISEGEIQHPLRKAGEEPATIGLMKLAGKGIIEPHRGEDGKMYFEAIPSRR